MIYALLALLVLVGLVAAAWVNVSKQAYLKELEAGQNPALKKAIRKQYEDEKKADETELDSADVAGTIGFLNRLRPDEVDPD